MNLCRFEKLKAELGTLRTNVNKITGEELDKYQAYSETANPDAPAEDKPYTDEQEYVIELLRNMINLGLVLGQ